MTVDRAASLVLPGPVWSGQIFIQRYPSVSKSCCLVITHDVVSTDSVDSIVSCFDGAGRLLGPWAYVQHEGHLSLAAAGITLGDPYSILLRLWGGAGDKETSTSPAADTRPAATSASLQLPPPPPDGRVDAGSSSIPNGFEAEDVEDRMRAGIDTAGAQAADHDMSSIVYAQGSLGRILKIPFIGLLFSSIDLGAWLLRATWTRRGRPSSKASTLPT